MLCIITTEPPRVDYGPIQIHGVDTATYVFKEWKDNRTGKLLFVLSIIVSLPVLTVAYVTDERIPARH